MRMPHVVQTSPVPVLPCNMSLVTQPKIDRSDIIEEKRQIASHRQLAMSALI